MTGGPDDTEAAGFRSAEEWLAAKGIERRPIRVDPAVSDQGDRDDAGSSDPAGPAPSAREVGQLATEAPPVVPGDGVDPSAPGSPPTVTEADAEPGARVPAELGDEVARAIAFIQRSTASTPAGSGRLERKLAARDVPAAAIRLAMEDARAQGLVDDGALAASLVEEGRAKGHAPRRLRADLRKRELPDPVIDAAMATIGDRDPEAVAFDIAARKAREYRGLDAEAAFRRLVGFLARRGHNEGLARKVARQVVFDDRESDRVTGH